MNSEEPATGARPILSARHLRLGPSPLHPVLDNGDLDIQRGETVAIVGRSGKGKSVLLSALLGFARPLAGEIRFNGELMRRGGWERMYRRSGVAFQHPALFNDLSIRQNFLTAEADLALARELILELQILRLDPQAESDPAALERWLDVSPRNLSGGEKKRLALARALAREPELLFLDEPTSGLDPDARDRVAHVLEEWNQRRSTTTVLTTHDFELAARIADRIVVLLGEGGILELAPGPDTVATEERILAGLLDSPGNPLRLGSRGNRLRRLVSEPVAALRTLPREAIDTLVTLRHLPFGLAGGLPRTIQYLSGTLLFALVGFGIGQVLLLHTAKALTDTPLPISIKQPLLQGLIQGPVREIGPLVGGLLIAGLLGSRVAAEIGGRTLANEIDALRVQGDDPDRELFAPIALGMVLASVLLIFTMTATLIAGGWLASGAAQVTISFKSLLHYLSRYTAAEDFVGVLAKGVLIGLGTAIIGYRLGLKAHTGPGSIGRMATRSVVFCVILVVLVDYVVNRLVYFGS